MYSSKEKLSRLQYDRRGISSIPALVKANLQKLSQLVYVLLYRKQGRHYALLHTPLEIDKIEKCGGRSGC